MPRAATVKGDGRVARRVVTRDAILDAATELFAARGVTSTSIDDIAGSAQIAKGSVYYNFESKAGLVEAVMARSGYLLAGALTEAVVGRNGTELRRAVVRSLLAVIRDHTADARVMVTEMFRTERSWRESIEQWRLIAISPLVADLERQGVGREQARLQAAAIVGATLVTGLEWLVFHPEYDHEEVVAAVLATLGY